MRQGLRSRGVLCAGAIVHDTLVQSDGDSGWGTNTLVDSMESHVGGNAANTSLALATIGAPVRIIGWIGDDEPGRFVIRRLSDANVDTGSVFTGSGPTAATIGIVNSDGQRKFLHRLGVSAEAFPESFDFAPDQLEGMAHFHLCSLNILPQLRRTAPGILSRARKAGLTTSLDTNWDPQGRWLQDIEQCIPLLNYMLMNEDEMRMLTGTDDPVAGAKFMIDRGAGAVVVKLGSRGCLFHTGSESILSPAFPTDVVDTTGAGDCFTAGFLDSLLTGDSLLAALLFANATGALSVQKLGALGNMKDRQAINSWINSTG